MHMAPGEYANINQYGNVDRLRQERMLDSGPVISRDFGYNTSQNFRNFERVPREEMVYQQNPYRFYDNHLGMRTENRMPHLENYRFSREERFEKFKPPCFNGSYEEWPYFKRLFLNASNLNGWNNQQRLYNLLNSLQGDARTFIISMEAQLSHLSFEEVIQMMETRFGIGDRSAHFQSLLEGRTWKWGDNLRTYQDEIRRLVSLAFPEVQGWNHQEILVKKYFCEWYYGSKF